MLRPYQTEAIDAIKTNLAAGVTRQLLVLATGGGKTVIAAHLPPLAKGKKMMFLVHRDELVWQAANKIKKYNPSLSVGIEKANHTSDSRRDDVIVASVQTIGILRDGKNARLTKFDRDSVGVLVIDETHHALAKTYGNVMRHFRMLKQDHPANDGRLLLGITATPNRSDNLGLEAIYDKIVYSKGIREMISEDWLVNIRAFRVDTDVDLSGVRTVRGDFEIKALQKTVNTKERNELIVAKYITLASGQIALAFTVDIQHAIDLSQEFNDAGIVAAAISGKTPEAERKDLIERHAAGEVKVLCSCGVFNEGVDQPPASVGIMARPTQSNLLYTQQIGRLLRPWPPPEEQHLSLIKKNHATIIDFVDNSGRHAINTVPSLFGLPFNFNGKGKKITEIVEEVEEVRRKSKAGLLEFTTIEEVRAHAIEIDILRVPVVAKAVKRLSRFAWIEMGEDSYQLFLQDYTVLNVRQNALGSWDIYSSVRGVRRVVGIEIPTLADAIDAADGLVPQQQKSLLMRAGRWRKEKITDAQVDLLARLDPNKHKFASLDEYKDFVRRNYNRGEASSLISQIMQERTSARAS